MWSKLRKLLRAKPATEQDDNRLSPDGGKLPVSSTCATSECSVRNVVANSSDLQVLDSQEDHCHCSPLSQIQQHLFGSFKTKRTSDSCDYNERNQESVKELKNQDGNSVSDSPSSQSTCGEISVRLSDCDKIAKLDLNNCRHDVSNGRGTIKDSCELNRADLDFENKDGCVQLTTERDICASSLSEPMQLSPPRLTLSNGENSRSITESVASYLLSGNDLEISDQKLNEYPFYDDTNSPCFVDTERIQTMLVNTNDLECCAGNIIEKIDDKEGSTDSGHHLSEGDVDKDHSSPELELDDFDGRESGYTTLDEVHPLSLEQSKLCLVSNMPDNVFKENSPEPVLVNSPVFYFSQPLDLSMSTGKDGGRGASCFDWPQSASVLAPSTETLPHHETPSGEPSANGFRDTDGIDRFRGTDGMNSQLWEKVDYVPADASVSKIFEDGLASGSNEVYASVPRTCNSKTDEALSCEAFAVPNSPEKRTETSQTKSSEQKDLEICSAGLLNLTAEKELSCGDFVESDNSVFFGFDSDDGEIVPPLPQRNYELYASFGDAELNLTKFSEAEDVNEQIHMTWEELMKEAKDLGIPLSGPQCDKSPVNIPDEAFVRSDVAISQVPEKDKRIKDARGEHGQGFDGLVTSKTDAKKGSPIKEKFRLPSIFTKKNRGERTGTGTENGRHLPAKEKRTSIFRHHSSVDIQKRCLPCPPPCEQQCNWPFVVFHKAGHTDMFSKAKTNRMAVSMHLPVDSDNRSWGSSGNILHGVTTESTGGRRSRRVFSDSSQCCVSSTGSRLSCADLENGRANCLDSLSSDGRNMNEDFIQSFSKLKDCGWYWGPLGWENAEVKLEDKPDGSFLVRDSSDDRYILSLSFRSQSVTHHTRIEHYKGMFSFYSQPKSHGASTIVEFIEKAMEHSQSGRFLYFLRPRAPGLPPTPVQLLFPISRLRNMHSLQHMCRFIILKHVRHDLIDRLPIPQRLKEYLQQMQYYVEPSDCDSMGHQFFSPAW